MTNIKSSFYYDAVRGIYLHDNIVKFNIVSVPMAQNDTEEKITLISSLSRFESMVNFLSDELKKMKSMEISSDKVETPEKNIENEKIPEKGKILDSFEKKI